MSSDRTKQICLWMTIYIYVCMYIEKFFEIKRTKYHASKLSFWFIQLSRYFYHTVRITKINHFNIYILLYIITIIMLCYQYGYSWPSLATPPYRPLLPADFQGYILYGHRAAVRRFKLDVLPLLVHVKGSAGVHYSWSRPYFFSSVPRVWLV